MPTLVQLIAEKTAKLDSIPKAFLTDVNKAQYEILNRILTRLSKLSLDGSGNIKMTADNLRVVQSISGDLGTIFNESEYVASVTDFAASFDISKAVSDKYFRSAFPEYSNGKFADNVFDMYKKQAIENLSSSTIETQFLAPLKTQMTQMVSSGMSFTESVQALRKYAVGDGNVDGKLLQYSRQIAYDTIAQTDRAYTSAVAEELGAEWFFYGGGLLKTSRGFCKERNGKHYHYKEVEDWAALKWDGKMANTTKQSIFENLGGYNCNHVLIPVSIDQVPASVVGRNVRSGNYVRAIVTKKK